MDVDSLLDKALETVKTIRLCYCRKAVALLKKKIKLIRRRKVEKSVLKTRRDEKKTIDEMIEEGETMIGEEMIIREEMIIKEEMTIKEMMIKSGEETKLIKDIMMTDIGDQGLVRGQDLEVDLINTEDQGQDQETEVGKDIERVHENYMRNQRKGDHQSVPIVEAEKEHARKYRLKGIII
jgi:hypothetical protein